MDGHGRSFYKHTPYNTLKQFLAEDYTLVGDALPRSGNG